VQIKYKN